MQKTSTTRRSPDAVNSLSSLPGFFALVAIICRISTPPDVGAQICVTPAGGMVHWWRAEGDAIDDSGTLHGDLYGGTTFSTGLVGQAFSFDGVNDCVTNSAWGLTNIVDFYTTEFWAWPTGGRASTVEATVGIYGDGNQRYAIFPYQGPTGGILGTGVSVGTNGVSVFEGGPAHLPALLVYDAPIIGWTHIAVVYDNRTPSLYVNGVLVHTGLTSVNPSCPSTWLGERGAASVNQGFYAGLLDEIAIYDRPLTATEVQEVYNAGSAGKCLILVGPSVVVDLTNQTATAGHPVSFHVGADGSRPLSYQWLFNQIPIAGASEKSYVIPAAATNHAGDYFVIISNSIGSVTSSVAMLIVNPPSCVPLVSNMVSWWKGEGSAVDQIGTNHGSLAGHAAFADGVVGRGFVFDGNGDFISVGSPEELKVQDFSIECWVKRSSTSVASFQGPLGMIFAWGQNGYGLYIDASGKPALSRVGIHNITYPTPLITDTNFHHLVVTKAGAAVIFYVDGVAYPAGDYNTTFTFTSGARIGAWDNPATHSFFGRIDELAVYSRPLIATEIQAIYESGILGKCVPPAAPSFLAQPVSQTVNVSNNVVFITLALGGPPPTYQWRLNGVNLAGATNASLTVSNALPSKAGDYTVAITNDAGSAISSNALLKVRVLTATGNGLPLSNSVHAFSTNVTVIIQNFFTNGLLFYTLDGSTPTIFSPQYTGPFLVTQSATLRVLAYSADFFEAGESDPVSILLPPSYALDLFSGGGGTIGADPGPGPYYLSNTVITLTATPNAGWTFLKWLGDAGGNNPETNVTLSRNKSVQAVFGTTLGTTAAGGGSVAVNPPGGTYPYGTTLQLSAIPDAGKFFALWGNAASGNVNPLLLTLTNANPTVSSLFASLSGGQVALAVVPVGRGSVSVNPRANSYVAGSGVTLTATPEAGQEFLGWSGDATGTQNPLSATLNTSQVIQANFTARPVLSLRDDQRAIAQEGAMLTARGADGEVYRLENSSNLVHWDLLGYVTNAFGTAQATDPAATKAPQRFYRALTP